MTNRFLNRTTEWLVMLIGAALVWAAIAWVSLRSTITIIEEGENPGIARAEAINIAAASFIQSVGRGNAVQAWRSAEGDQGRYELLSPILAHAPAIITEYMPDGYSIELWPELQPPFSKVRLLHQNKEIVY